MSGLQPPPHPRSPSAGDASASASISSSTLADLSKSPNSPGAGPASPPYLSVHPSRTSYAAGPGSGPAQTAFGTAARPPPLKIPASPARAHTHRILSAGTQPPPVPHFHHPASRDSTHTPPPRVNHSTVAATPSAAAPATTTNTSYSVPLASPCFVHSHLDPNLNGSAATAAAHKAKKKARARPAELVHDAMAKRTGEDAADKTPTQTARALNDESEGDDGNEEEDGADDDDGYEDEDDSEDERNTWTRQLAETAVSVREMSRQLGRARVVSHIQSVMIVTKARDNQLTKLTRELALYLMKKPRNGKDRGLVVYVDSQLRKAKRFDAEGIERDNPELFRPLPHRRYSRSNSSASLATDVGPLRGNGAAGGHSRGTLTPLTMTNLGEALVKRNNSIGGSEGGGRPQTPSSRRAQGSAQGQSREQEAEEGQLRYWTNDMCRKSPHLFDFVITLGGDGTVLYTSWLFQQVVPPVIPFALGSLGFLTNFDYADFRPTLDAAIETGVRVNLRMRFTCTVYRAVDEGDDSNRRRQAIRSGKTGGIFMKSLTREGWEAIENGKPLSASTPGGGGKGKDKAIKCFSTRPVESFEVLNDLVVDRGPSPYVSQLELFGDEHHMTTVQADGLTVSTPTGSTAYSLSAGGSLVHPEIPAILITPICPHTLSFRPMLLPDSMELRICVPYNSRSTAWASFDGRGRVELRQGDHIKVTASPYPFPTVCADKQSTDWFHSIARTLKWNERQRQKSFVILEEGRKKVRPSDAGEQSAKRTVHERTTARSPLSNAETVRGRSPSKRGERAPRQSSSSGPTKRATFADAGPGGEDVCEDEDDEDEDELDEDGDDTAEEYDIDDVSESSPSISASDPPVPSGGIPAMSSKSTSPTSNASANDTLHPPPSMATTRSTTQRLDFELLSNASSVSVDIQDDVTERFRDKPPQCRGRSRSRARLQQEQRDQAHRSSRTGGAVSIDESDDDKSRDRAFAVLGHDDDDSSQASGTESGTWNSDGGESDTASLRLCSHFLSSRRLDCDSTATTDDPLIGMTFSFAPSAPSRERDDAPRGGNGSQVLPVAQLDDDFDGQPEDGLEYLFLVRREASQRAKITRAPNPFVVVEAAGAPTSVSTSSAVSRPDEAWRQSFVRNFASARQRMQRAPINALEPIDPAVIPPPRDGSTWRVFVSGKRAKPSRPSEAPTSETVGTAALSTLVRSSGSMEVDSAPVDELAAMKAEVLASLELDLEDEARSQQPETEQPRFGVPPSNSPPAPSDPPAVSAVSEPEYDRLPRLPSPALISAIPGPSIVHVLSHFDDWLTERLEAYEEKVNYVPSTIFAPPSLRRRAGAAGKAAASRSAAPLPVVAAPPNPPRSPIGRAPLPTAHESHWMLSLLTRLEQVLDGDDLATLRQLAKTLVKLVEASVKSQSAKPGAETGRSMEARRLEEEEAEGRARCWMIVAAIASTWSQADLWDPSL